MAGIALAATAAGVGAAVAAGAVGGGGVPACAAKSSGKIVLQRNGNCSAGQFAITISGSAFKRRGGTLTINGVAFKKGSGKTLTINGTTFHKSKGGTLTINGTTFNKSKGGTLTINGVAFRKGSGNTLTINGTEFKGSRGQTLTINGIPFTGAAGTQGPAGPQGLQGPPGVNAASAGAPVVVPGPIDVTQGGATVALVSVLLGRGDGSARRALLTGGFDAACVAPCPSSVQGVYDVVRDGNVQLTRRLPSFSAAGISDMSGIVSEVVDVPAGCAPCTFTLRLQAAGPVGGAGASTLRATAIRLAAVDLGPAG
jgi:hypothetical protein